MRAAARGKLSAAGMAIAALLMLWGGIFRTIFRRHLQLQVGSTQASNRVSPLWAIVNPDGSAIEDRSNKRRVLMLERRSSRLGAATIKQINRQTFPLWLTVLAGIVLIPISNLARIGLALNMQVPISIYFVGVRAIDCMCCRALSAWFRVFLDTT